MAPRAPANKKQKTAAGSSASAAQLPVASASSSSQQQQPTPAANPKKRKRASAKAPKDWYHFFQEWIKARWVTLVADGKKYGIIPANVAVTKTITLPNGKSKEEPLVTIDMLKSTDMSDPTVALCHYLVDAYNSIVEEYDDKNLSGYPIALWAFPELQLEDVRLPDGPVVLRCYLKDPGGNFHKNRRVHNREVVNDLQWDYGCVDVPVPSYWRLLPRLRVYAAEE